MHTCPVCGQACYCNGDIDDIQLDGTDEQLFCTHCPDDAEADPLDEDSSDEDYYRTREAELKRDEELGLNSDWPF